MSKLKQKLLDLGYTPYTVNELYFAKEFNKYYLDIDINKNLIDIEESCIDVSSAYIYNQQDIDNLQQAYNQLQKDLKELRKNEIY